MKHQSRPTRIRRNKTEGKAVLNPQVRSSSECSLEQRYRLIVVTELEQLDASHKQSPRAMRVTLDGPPGDLGIKAILRNGP